jgi:hypothetical protein
MRHLDLAAKLGALAMRVAMVRRSSLLLEHHLFRKPVPTFGIML